MPRTDNEVRVSLSVLDRLIDYEPDVSREAPGSRARTLRLLKQFVRRDLEWLLNTRRTPDLPPGLEEVSRSVLAYGLPDFTARSVKSYSDRERLLGEIEEAIRVFEPRLEGVSVHLEESGGKESGLRFRIEARLRVDPAPEPVSFDTFLKPGVGQFEVRED